jgi:hypothetical protein
MATAGWIMGIIGTIFLALWVVYIIVTVVTTPR